MGNAQDSQRFWAAGITRLKQRAPSRKHEENGRLRKMRESGFRNVNLI